MVASVVFETVPTSAVAIKVTQTAVALMPDVPNFAFFAVSVSTWIVKLAPTRVLFVRTSAPVVANLALAAVCVHPVDSVSTFTPDEVRVPYTATLASACAVP